MNRKVEDKMVSQIEKSLSNNMNDNLFLVGRTYEKENSSVNNAGLISDEHRARPIGLQQNNSDAYFEYQPASVLSREEYVRQARESCLRQLSSVQRNTQRAYDMMYLDEPVQNSELTNKKKAKALHLLRDNSAPMHIYRNREENTLKGLDTFQFLTIRMVCAIVLFLSIFLLDKFDYNIGSFTPQIIQEYVTGNDTLQELEDILMTWLK